MYHILRFSKLRSTRVERIQDDLLISTCYLKDNLHEAEVRITVRLPDLEIEGVRARLNVKNRPVDIPEAQLRGILNARIGPGIFKLITSAIETDYEQISMMIEECCRGVILSFTKDDLLKSPRPEDDDAAIEYYADMVRDNVRLYNRCAAFAPGSRIISHIEQRQER